MDRGAFVEAGEYDRRRAQQIRRVFCKQSQWIPAPRVGPGGGGGGGRPCGPGTTSPQSRLVAVPRLFPGSVFIAQFVIVAAETSQTAFWGRFRHH